MTTISRVAGTVSQTEGEDRPRLDPRGHLITVLLSAWLIAGLFLDAWAHGQNLTETFFTPWHALLYSGYLAVAIWMVRPVARSVRAGQPPFAAVPAGYAPGVVGVLMFAVGGVFDGLWHMLYGIENGIEALLSPPHFFLILGLVLIVSSPFRAAWAVTNPESDAPSLGAFLPALLSLALALSVIMLIFYPLWGFGSSHYMNLGTLEWIKREFVPTAKGLPLVYEATQQRGISNILITNVLLLAPVLMILRRWRPPFGSVTILFTFSTVLMATMTGFVFLSLLLVPLIAGVFADSLIRTLAPSPVRIREFRLFAAVVPVVVWSLYFLSVHFEWGVIWPPALWAGVILWAGLSGLGLSLVAIPSGPQGRGA